MVINGQRSLFHDMVNSFNCQLLHGFWRLVNLSLEYNPVTSCPFKKGKFRFASHLFSKRYLTDFGKTQSISYNRFEPTNAVVPVVS